MVLTLNVLDVKRDYLNYVLPLECHVLFEWTQTSNLKNGSQFQIEQ